jgi:putative photosynthetic complex assembly protein
VNTEPSRGDKLGRQAPYILLALAGTALLIVAVARLAGYPPATAIPADVLLSRDLRFEDSSGGSVNVYDWENGELLESYPAGDGSFVRGVLRAMTRERKSMEEGSETPFRLARHQDGALTIEDLATGRLIVLNAFGPTNAGVFSNLLRARRDT